MPGGCLEAARKDPLGSPGDTLRRPGGYLEPSRRSPCGGGVDPPSLAREVDTGHEIPCAGLGAKVLFALSAR